MDATSPSKPPPAVLHPLLAALEAKHGFALVDGAVDDLASRPGMALVALLEDPARQRETLDLAVIAPELARAFPGTFRCAALLPPAARDAAARFGVRRFPALVVLRDGGYVGAIEGLREWSEYVETLAPLLTAPVTRPPGIGIAVRGGEPTCGSAAVASKEAT
jgi:hydrogenase-1 operon protein HyaE